GAAGAGRHPSEGPVRSAAVHPLCRLRLAEKRWPRAWYTCRPASTPSPWRTRGASLRRAPDASPELDRTARGSADLLTQATRRTRVTRWLLRVRRHSAAAKVGG